MINKKAVFQTHKVQIASLRQFDYFLAELTLNIFQGLLFYLQPNLSFFQNELLPDQKETELLPL